MHKKIILLLKGDNKEEVNLRVVSYLKDWEKQFNGWVIGGHFSGELDNNLFNNVVPLSGCLDLVKKEVQDPIKEYERLISQAEKWLVKKEDGGYLIDGGSILGRLVSNYIYDLASQFQEQQLSVYCNIYNLDTEDYSIPINLENWYAVIIDLSL